MILSIIIPVYNIEKYLSECLSSVFSQELDDFEVICVNDGSTDNSQAIIDSYASKHLNLRCINQPNGGLSDARNTGIDNSQGKLIFFLDGDDTIADNHTLATALKICKDNDLDLFVGNALVDSQHPYLDNFPKDNGLLTGPELTHLFLTNSRTIIEPVWCYIYKRDFINTNNLRFKKGIYHEDVLFTPQALCLAKRTMCSDTKFVDYTTSRTGAITSFLSLKHLSDRRDTARQLHSFFNTHPDLGLDAQRIVFDIYLETFTLALTNKIPFEQLFDKSDFSIIQRCATTRKDTKTAHLLKISPRLGTMFGSNQLKPIIRKLINKLPI